MPTKWGGRGLRIARGLLLNGRVSSSRRTSEKSSGRSKREPGVEALLGEIFSAVAPPLPLPFPCPFALGFMLGKGALVARRLLIKKMAAPTPTAATQDRVTATAMMVLDEGPEALAVPFRCAADSHCDCIWAVALPQQANALQPHTQEAVGVGLTDGALVVDSEVVAEGVVPGDSDVVGVMEIDREMVGVLDAEAPGEGGGEGVRELEGDSVGVTELEGDGGGEGELEGEGALVVVTEDV